MESLRSGVFVTLVFCLTACVGGLGERSIEVEFHPSPDASQWSTWRDGEVRPATPPPPIAGEIWERRLTSDQMEDRPTPELIRRAHPRGAIEQGEVGAVILEGRVLEDGSLAWRVLSVSSLGWHFEDAAILVASKYRAPLHFPNGRATLGASFLTVVAFTEVPRAPVIFDQSSGTR